MNCIINDKHKVINFLLEITDNDSKTISYIQNLVDVYPNILDYMISNIMPDLDKVKYVKYKRYNYLKTKVLENISILNLNKLLNDSFDISFLTKLKNYYKLKISNNDIDDETLNSIIYKKIRLQPYDTLCRIPGIGFIKADNILLNAYNKQTTLWNFNIRTSEHRCISFIIYYLIYCLNGSTCVSIEKLKKDMLYRFYLDDCLNVFENAILDKKFKILNGNIMLYSTFLEEQNISKFVKNSLAYNIDWNINTQFYNVIDNFTLTETQLETLNLINKNQLVLLNGYAGTGKSSSIKALINMLEDNNKSYKILAPTAKAAKQISLYTERHASTIHYLLCSDFPTFDNHLDEDNEYNNIFNISNSSDNDDYLDYDIIIIDEVSMLSVSLFNILIKYINPQRTKILLIGDSYQLPSIQNGNLYQDLLSINEIPKITLNEIFRYKENGLVSVATDIRFGKQYLDRNENIQVIGNSYTFFKYEDTGEMLNAALNKYLDLLNEGNEIEDVAILTAKNIGNSGTNLVNSCIQQVINKIEDYDEFITITVDKQKIRFKENDVIMNIKNNYNAISLKTDKKVLIANGQTGIVKSVDSFNNYMIVKIDDDEFKFDYGDICNCRLAYCFTIHKSQGSQFKYVIYLTTKEDEFMTNSNLEYVAVTRAKEACFHYGDTNTINRKVSERENLKRNTTLIYQFQNLK